MVKSKNADVGVLDIDHQKFIGASSSHLKKIWKPELPHWVDIVKTGVSRECPPSNPDWYHVRAASIMRKMYLKGGEVSCDYLRHAYGSSKRRGTKPNHHAKASGAVIRHILQDLEQMGFLEKSVRGRKLSKEGIEFMSSISKFCSGIDKI